MFHTTGIIRRQNPGDERRSDRGNRQVSRGNPHSLSNTGRAATSKKMGSDVLS